MDNPVIGANLRGRGRANFQPRGADERNLALNRGRGRGGRGRGERGDNRGRGGEGRGRGERGDNRGRGGEGRGRGERGDNRGRGEEGRGRGERGDNRGRGGEGRGERREGDNREHQAQWERWRGRGAGVAQRGRGGRGRGDGRWGTHGVRTLGYTFLNALLAKEESEVAITLSSSEGLQTLLQERTMRQDLVQLVCQVMRKAFRAHHNRHTMQHLAGTLKDSQFFSTILPQYVAAMMSDSIPDRRERYPQHIDDILALVSEVLSIFPASAVRTTSMLVALLKPAINQLRASGVEIPQSTDANLEKVQALVDHLQEKARDGTLRSDTYTFIGAEEEAPPGEENFRTMTIYPTPEELHREIKPFLRPNITAQSYPSTHVYLDTHFRLLREDFVRPLREGIQELLASQQDEGLGNGPAGRRRFDNIQVYFNTQLVVPLCTPTGIAYKVKFDVKPLKFVRWENSKRLLYGSLVCLSMDNFDTILFATVTERDPKMLQNGLVQLSFSKDSRPLVAMVEASHTFVMVETTAYFEAYRYVLEGLQEQEEDDFPFQKYVVGCNTDVSPPSYLLTEGRTYDLSSIAVKDKRERIRPFNPLTPEAWPSGEELGLDESQLRALKLALTNELAIIQGPPGTGKTYVGLRIAQTLLENQQAWSSGSPMLVVCYTNHALDQFLEGIHTFMEKGIVRVGSRSNSEVLKPFVLRELTRSSEFRNDLPQHLRRAFQNIRTDMQEMEQLIKKHSAHLECCLKGVLKEQFLQKYILDKHWDDLCLQPQRNGFFFVGEKPSMILEWLGLGSSHFQEEIQYAAGGDGEEDEVGMLPEEEELLEVGEVATMIQNERILFDAEPDFRDRKRDKKREEEALTELTHRMLAMNLDQVDQGPIPFQGVPDSGWSIQSHQKKKLKQMVRHELKKKSYMSEKDELAVLNIWSLSLKDRWRLYRRWLMRYQRDLRTRNLRIEHKYQEAAERQAEIRMREDLFLLKGAKVIGMTTTGAAKYRQVLQVLRPRLVVVEEAAEVLEAHIITTLSQDCKHLILIGDHQQLRPSATVYELAKNFNLEVSMFERLVQVNFPFVRLNYQHRMRPDIARLLTPHIYSELENHPSVMEYEDIMGLLTNLFFLDHECPEEEIKDGRSRMNHHEALFVVALCRYLLCQDYQPSQITILTTYTGQLYCLRKLMPAREFSGVKVHVVDKYQGEENDIVILSLVRSNAEGRVGFLQMSNRVCVALSRAKKGLYCIGNMSMFSPIKLWSGILHTLREKGQVGRALTISCQNHPDKQTLVSCAEDFKHAPEGGCNLPCQYRLDCGHVCIRACHPYDPEHKKYKCKKPCQKVLCELNHPCPRFCHEGCGDCTVQVEKVIPLCRHKQMVPCHMDPNQFVCKEPCLKLLSCGHPCRAYCGSACTTNCGVIVTMELSCGHMQEERCYVSRNPKQEPSCRTMCKTLLKCGHPCPGTCHACHRGRLHQACNNQCKRILVCSHLCREPCTQDCPPCSLPCENRCVHSVCKKACGQPCAPCVEPCAWQCPHQSCSKLCHEPCDRPPCTQACDKVLPCGHPCIGFCGDPCPKKCKECHFEEVTEILFGTEDEPDARFVQLEDCGHLFESTAMDQFIGQDTDKDAELGQLAVHLKECPRCRTPIRRNLRYGTHVNRSLAEIEMVKEKIKGDPADIKQQQSALMNLLEGKTNLKQYIPEDHALIMEKLERPDVSLRVLWHLENLIRFLETLGHLKMMQENHMAPDMAGPFSNRVGECLGFLRDPVQRFSEQQVWDLEREVKRLSYLAELNARCKKANLLELEVQLKEQVKELRDVLEDTLPFTEAQELYVKRSLEQLERKLPISGLCITEEEREMIVKAMAMNKGHWFKCPNGHIYAIGDCGGAVVTSQCPVCKAVIGGTQHTLRSDNIFAPEMDGAEHPAWSDTANMQNYAF